jgi:hypothetical protein
VDESSYPMAEEVAEGMGHGEAKLLDCVDARGGGGV